MITKREDVMPKRGKKKEDNSKMMRGDKKRGKPKRKDCARLMQLSETKSIRDSTGGGVMGGRGGIKANARAAEVVLKREGQETHRHLAPLWGRFGVISSVYF